jgi:hypothetical protein
MTLFKKLKLAFQIVSNPPIANTDLAIAVEPEEDNEFKGVTGTELKFEILVPTKNRERTAELEKFAQSFGHKIIDYRHTIIIVKKNRQIIGYCQIVNSPIVYPALHTDRNVCSRRDVIEIMKAFTGWAKIQNGEGHIAVPIGSKTFLPHILKKLGFYPQQAEIYSVDGDN